MVDSWVPDEIGVKYVTEVQPVAVPTAPEVGVYAVDRLQHRAFISLLPVVPADQVAIAFGNLKSYLHTHGALRQRPDQGFEPVLVPIPHLVARIIGVHAAELVAGDERAINLNGDVIQQVADAQLLAERRRGERLLMLLKCYRHISSSGWRYSRVNCESCSSAE